MTIDTRVIRIGLIAGVAVLLLSPSSSAFSRGPHAAVGGGAEIGGGCSPVDNGAWSCLFIATITDPRLVAFRWDFEGDGRWDTPWRGDLGPIPYWSSVGGVWHTTLQVWDGISMKDGEPDGPRVYKDLVMGGDLLFSPYTWTRTSTGTLWAAWELPMGFSPPGGRPGDANLFGVPAEPLWRPRAFASEPPVQGFRVDRVAVTNLLGPGAHSVLMRGHWGSYEFVTLWTGVTIL